MKVIQRCVIKGIFGMKSKVEYMNKIRHKNDDEEKNKNKKK